MSVLLDRVSRLIGKPIAAREQGRGRRARPREHAGRGGAVERDADQGHGRGPLRAGQAAQGRRARRRACRSRCARTWRANRSADVWSSAGRIDERMLDESMRRSKATGKRQGEVLIQMGAITESDLHEALDDAGRRQAARRVRLDRGPRVDAGRCTRDDASRPSSPAGRARQTILRGARRVNATVVAKRLEPYQGCEVSQDEPAPRGGRERRRGRRPVAGGREAAARRATLMNPHATTLYALWLIGARRPARRRRTTRRRHFPV